MNLLVNLLLVSVTICQYSKVLSLFIYPPKNY